jgi:anti-sigma B factor antagonist
MAAELAVDPPGLSVTRRDAGEEAMLVVRGEIDMATGPALDRQLRIVEASSARRIVLDFASLDFMDSTAIHVLVSAQQRADANGHELVLANLPAHAHRLLSLTGVEASLTVR